MWDFTFSWQWLWWWQLSGIEPCSLIELHWRFRGVYYLHHSSSCWWNQYMPLKRQSTWRTHGTISQKSAIFIFCDVFTVLKDLVVLGQVSGLLCRGFWFSSLVRSLWRFLCSPLPKIKLVKLSIPSCHQCVKL